MRPNPQETAEKDLYLMKPQGTADLVTFTEEWKTSFFVQYEMTLSEVVLIHSLT